MSTKKGQTDKQRESAIAAALAAWHETPATHVVAAGGSKFDDELYRAIEDLEDVPTVDGVRLTWRLCPLEDYPDGAVEIRGSWEADLPSWNCLGTWYGREPDGEWEKLGLGRVQLIAEFQAQVTHVFKGELYHAIYDVDEGDIDPVDGHDLALGLYSLHNWAAAGGQSEWPDIRGYAEGGEEVWYEAHDGDAEVWQQVWPVKVREIPDPTKQDPFLPSRAELNAKVREVARKPWAGKLQADVELKERIKAAREAAAWQVAWEAEAAERRAAYKAVYKAQQLKAGRKQGGMGTGGVR